MLCGVICVVFVCFDGCACVRVVLNTCVCVCLFEMYCVAVCDLVCFVCSFAGGVVCL